MFVSLTFLFTPVFTNHILAFLSQPGFHCVSIFSSEKKEKACRGPTSANAPACTSSSCCHSYFFPIYWQFHNPNWQTPSFFQRGRAQPPTRESITPRKLSQAGRFSQRMNFQASRISRTHGCTQSEIIRNHDIQMLWVLSHVLPLLVLHALGPFSPWVSLGCEFRLLAAQKWYCKNIDDCAKLKHGCGALGLCALTPWRVGLSENIPQNPSKSHGWSMLIIIFPLEYRQLYRHCFFLMFLKCFWRAWTVGSWINIWGKHRWCVGWSSLDLSQPMSFPLHVFWVFANCSTGYHVLIIARPHKLGKNTINHT